MRGSRGCSRRWPSPSTVLVAAAGDRDPASAKKATLKVATSQKQALQARRAPGQGQGAERRARSSSRRSPRPSTSRSCSKLTKAAKVRAQRQERRPPCCGSPTRAASAIESCEARKIVVSGKGAKQGQGRAEAQHQGVQAEADRPQPRRRLRLHRRPGRARSACCRSPTTTTRSRTSSTATGRRVDFTDAGDAAEPGGTPIAAAPYNLNDGFSPGQVITLKVPGLDTPEALAKHEPDPAQRPEPQRVAGLEGADRRHRRRDRASGCRSGSRSTRNATHARRSTAVLIHAATQFEAGPPLHRRHAQPQGRRAATSSPRPRASATTATTCRRTRAAINDQRKRFENLFRDLRKAKVKRANLYLAWDFTVASDENIAQRMLHIRNDAFAAARRHRPRRRRRPGHGAARSRSTTVDANPDAPGSRAGCEGTFTVPCYLTNNCEAPATFTLDANGNPTRQGNYQANFDCIIPHAAVDDPGCPGAAVALRPRPARRGRRGQLGRRSGRWRKTHNFVFCATDEIGFANEDIPNTIGILGDLGPVPRAHRPRPAGAAQRAAARAADGQPRRLPQPRRPSTPTGRRSPARR